MRTFTLVPIGGVGNRLHAIASAIEYCQKKDIFLTILWFKDHGLNCDVKNLFAIAPQIRNVSLIDNKWHDLLLRDNPRRKNFHIPRFFEKRFFDKCIYCYDNDFHVNNPDPELDDSLDGYDTIYMVNWGGYWRIFSIGKWMAINNDIKERVQAVIREKFTPNTIGMHIRRTDNRTTIRNSPTSLYIDAIKSEISKDSDVRIFLATDSWEEKRTLLEQFGGRIITSSNPVSRNTRQGIADAFVEMNLLAATRKVYAGRSSFAYSASLISGVELEILELKDSFR